MRVIKSIEDRKGNRHQPRYQMSTFEFRAHCSGRLNSLGWIIFSVGQRWNHDLKAMMEARLECIDCLIESLHVGQSNIVASTNVG